MSERNNKKSSEIGGVTAIGLSDATPELKKDYPVSWTPTEYADRYRVSRATVYLWFKRGGTPLYQDRRLSPHFERT